MTNDLADASRILQTLAVNAVVVDSHSPRLGDLYRAIATVLEIRRQITDGDSPPPLLVLMSENCSPASDAR